MIGRLNNQAAPHGVTAPHGFTWDNLTPGLVGSVAGPAAVGAARIGASLVNAPVAATQAITRTTAPLPFDIGSKSFGRATEVLSGVVSGSTAGSLGAAQAGRSQAAPTDGGGMTSAQNMTQFGTLPPSLGWGILGGGATGAYFGAAPAKAK